MKIFITAFALIASLSMALRVQESEVDLWSGYNKMTIDSYKNTLLTDTENVWVVAFITPHCAMCKDLAPIWGQIAKADTIGLRKVKFGYVNLDDEKSTDIIDTYTGDLSIEYTPSVIVYGSDKADPIEYDGDYSYDDLNRKLCGYCDKHGFNHPGAQPIPAPKQELQGGDADPEDVRILRAIGELALGGRFDGFHAPIQGFHGRRDSNGFAS